MEVLQHHDKIELEAESESTSTTPNIHSRPDLNATSTPRRLPNSNSNNNDEGSSSTTSTTSWPSDNLTPIMIRQKRPGSPFSPHDYPAKRALNNVTSQLSRHQQQQRMQPFSNQSYVDGGEQYYEGVDGEDGDDGDEDEDGDGDKEEGYERDYEGDDVDMEMLYEPADGAQDLPTTPQQSQHSQHVRTNHLPSTPQRPQHAQHPRINQNLIYNENHHPQSAGTRLRMQSGYPTMEYTGEYLQSRTRSMQPISNHGSPRRNAQHAQSPGDMISSRNLMMYNTVHKPSKRTNTRNLNRDHEETEEIERLERLRPVNISIPNAKPEDTPALGAFFTIHRKGESAWDGSRIGQRAQTESPSKPPGQTTKKPHLDSPIWANENENGNGNANESNSDSAATDKIKIKGKIVVRCGTKIPLSYPNWKKEDNNGSQNSTPRTPATGRSPIDLTTPKTPASGRGRKHAPGYNQYVSPHNRGMSAAPQMFASPQHREQMYVKTPEAGRRGRSMSIAPQTPSVQRRPSATQTFQTPLSVRRTYAQSLLQHEAYNREQVEQVEISSDSEGTPLNAYFARGRKSLQKNSQSQQNYAGNCFDAKAALPKEGVFHPHKEEFHTPEGRKSRMNALQFKDSPELISLLSSPETGLNSPVPPPSSPKFRSTPMKSRVAPLKKVTPKKGTQSRAPRTPKTPRKPKVTKVGKEKKSKADKKDKKPEESAEELRQKRAAELIVAKEIAGSQDAIDLEMFGEVVGEDDEEKSRKAEEAREEAKRERESRELKLLAEKEAKEAAELERLREQREKDEELRKQKEMQEMRDRERRKKQREYAEKTEQIAIEERRRKAQAIIEAGREREAAETEKRELEKQKANEVQVNPADLARLKAQQEKLKHQISTLSAAKIAGPPAEDQRVLMSEVSLVDDANDNSDGAVVAEAGDDSGTSDNRTINLDEDTAMEESLFVNENDLIPKKDLRNVYDVDERRRLKKAAGGPASAAELVAQAQAKAAAFSAGYRAERDKLDAERLKENAEKRRAGLQNRWNRAKSMQPEEQPPAAPRPVVRKEVLKPVKQKSDVPVEKPKVREAPVSAPAPVPVVPKSNNILDGLLGNALAQMQNLANDGGGLLAPSSASCRRAKAPAIPPAPKTAPLRSGVTFISNDIRQRLEREQEKLKKAAAKKPKKSRTEEEKAAGRRRATERAREKKKQQLIDEAKANGGEISEENLERELEAFMGKREREIQKRAENKAKREALAQQQEAQGDEQGQENGASNSLDSDNESEGVDFNKKLRTILPAKVHQPLNDLARQRGARFKHSADAARAAMQAEFEISLGLSESDSSDESEEDPDGDEPAARPESSSSSVTINNEEPIAIDDADVFDPEVVEQAVQAAPTVEARPAAPQRKRFTAPKPVSANPNECVRVYFVKQQKIIDGAWEDEPFLLAPYVDRQDANERLHREAEKCRAERPAKYIESIDTDSLCSAQIFYDEEEQNGIWFAVMSDPIAKSQLKNVDTTLLGKRYPERIWTVRRKITNRTVDEETNMTTINTETTRLEPSFSDLKLANNDAAKKMLDFLRPTVPRMDWVEKHENMCGAQIRESRDERNKAKLLFGAEVDKEELPWLNCESVEFEVLEGKIEGPLN